MDLRNVATLAGYKSHLTADGVRTLCGREVSNGTSGEDMCKRCGCSAVKLRAARERLEYDVRQAETQDDVMSQAAPVANPEHAPMSVMATTTAGEKFEYARIPNGDPERVEYFVAMAKRGGAFSLVFATPTPDPLAWEVEQAAQWKAAQTPAEPAWQVVDETTGEPVELPATRPDFRGNMGMVSGIAEPPTPGKSGKLYHDRMGQVCYPGVYGLKIVPVLTPLLPGQEGVYRPPVVPYSPAHNTVSRIAAHGHRMVYRVTGVDPDGNYRLSQWDAQHDATCPCLTEEN